MTRNIDFDDDRALTDLMTLAPDPERAMRTRQRCREVFDRRAAMAAAPSGIADHRRMRSMVGAALRSAMVGACCILCLVYVMALLVATARLHDLSR